MPQEIFSQWFTDISARRFLKSCLKYYIHHFLPSKIAKPIFLKKYICICSTLLPVTSRRFYLKGGGSIYLAPILAYGILFSCNYATAKWDNQEKPPDPFRHMTLSPQMDIGNRCNMANPLTTVKRSEQLAGFCAPFH